MKNKIPISTDYNKDLKISKMLYQDLAEIQIIHEYGFDAISEVVK